MTAMPCVVENTGIMELTMSSLFQTKAFLPAIICSWFGKPIVLMRAWICCPSNAMSCLFTYLTVEQAVIDNKRIVRAKILFIFLNPVRWPIYWWYPFRWCTCRSHRLWADNKQPIINLQPIMVDLFYYQRASKRETEHHTKQSHRPRSGITKLHAMP